jgi:hypothetical protein
MKMSPVEQTLLTLKFEVIRLANEMPDFYYYPEVIGGSFRYTSGGCDSYPDNSGCIVGQAARNIDPSLYSVMENNDYKSIIKVLSIAYINDKRSGRDWELTSYLSDVQYNQDRKEKWLDCI